VSYERLACDPETVLGEVCETIGCSFEATMVSRFRDGPCHGISGNRMRFEQRGIELDEAWRELLSSAEQAWVRTISRMPLRALLAALRGRAVLRGGRGR
jgi:hypothetical protein